MRLLVCLVFWSGGLLLPHALTAQSTTYAVIEGSVFSGDDLEPLPGVNVFIASSMTGTVTDSDGEFRLERLPIGALRLTISMIGYEPLILPYHERTIYGVGARAPAHREPGPRVPHSLSPEGFSRIQGRNPLSGRVLL